MLAVSISFFNLEFIGWHVFDFRSSHIYFQGQFSLYFFPFVCSIFLDIVFALVDFVFNAFLVIILLQPLPGVKSNSLSDYWRVTLLSLEPRLSFTVLPVPLYLSGCNSQASAFRSDGSREWHIRWLRFFSNLIERGSSSGIAVSSCPVLALCPRFLISA